MAHQLGDATALPKFKKILSTIEKEESKTNNHLEIEFFQGLYYHAMGDLKNAIKYIPNLC